MERLKQKVASSSSRVIASLQQAAGASLPAHPSQPPTQAANLNQVPAQQESSSQQQQAQLIFDNNFQQAQQLQQPAQSIRAPTTPAPQQHQHQHPAQPQAQPQAQTQNQPAPLVPDAAMSTAWLMAADATAHLTEEEREILLEVFKKEEQFQRDTIKHLRAQQQQHQHQQQQQQSGEPGPNQAPAASLAGRQPFRSSLRNSNKENHPRQSHQQHQTSNHSQTPTTAAGQSPQLSAASSSRPGSSSTPTCSSAGAANQRAPGSVCSQSSESQPQSQSVGQCRICRKIIGPQEPCHLCSNCQHFICDDCASYSATDQHWMCSSCRRRAMNPAIPAEALKELGLNQNSSAVRRMTLRLNQNELKMALNKSSGQAASSSSNSSSNCSSSVSTSTGAGGLQARQQQQQQPQPAVSRPQGGGGGQTPRTNQVDEQREPQQQRPAGPLQRQADQSQHQAQGARTKAFQTNSAGRGQFGGNQQQANYGANLANSTPTRRSPERRLAAQKTMSQPTAHNQGGGSQHDQLSSGKQRQSTSVGQSSPLFRPPSSASASCVGGPNETPTGGSPTSAARLHQQQHQQQADLRRASMASQQQQMIQQQQSSLFQQQQQQSAATFVGLGQTMMQQQQQQQPQQTKRDSIAASMGSLVGNQTNLIGQANYAANHQLQTLITASSEASLGCVGGATAANTRRQSIKQQQQQQLVPIPPEQMHLRRLSDQSNLVRRSSIVADSLDGIQLARNRSHSNIDSMALTGGYLMYQQHQHQQPFVNHHQQQQQLNLPANYQQRRLSDQWDQQQRQQQLQLSSIVTSCQQKKRHSSEDLNTDSSSDIDDEPGPAASRQPGGQNGYLYAEGAYTGGQYQQQQQQPPINIPSVSVSEFHVANQRRMSMATQQAQQQQQQPLLIEQPYQDQITPMQINVAIEQVIQQQQQREQRKTSAAGANCLAPNGQTSMMSMVMMRRGSGGRILPRVPGEQQSRSLLDLPQHHGDQTQSAAGQSGGGGGSSGRLLQAADGQSALMLDLPSPTIRRASAPEGQNIKIVVDDIDAAACFRGGAGGGSGLGLGLGLGGAGHAHASAGHHKLLLNGTSVGLNCVGGSRLHNSADYLERLVLYRDDSLDPASNNAGRGFGLQVMGGKMVASAAGGDPQQAAPAAAAASGPLQATVSWVLAGGPADKVGLRPGDKIIEWDGKCLLDMSYEQVAEVIESSANIAELLIKPAARLEPQPAASYVRSQRRLSQQTERDLRRFQEHQPQQFSQQQQPLLTGPLNGYLNQSAGDFNNQRRSSGQFQLTSASSSQQQQQDPIQLQQRSGTGRKLPQIPGQAMQQQQQHQNQDPLLYGNSVLLARAQHASTGQLEHTGRLSGQYEAQFGNPHLVPFNSLASTSSSVAAAAAAGAATASSSTTTGGLHHLAKPDQQQQQSRSATELHGPAPNQLLAAYYSQPTGGSATNSSLAINTAPLAQQQQQQQQAHYTGLNHSAGQYFSAHPMAAIHNNNNTNQLSAAHYNQGPDEICGLIGLQVNVDERMAQLEISVLSAINMDRNPALDYVVKVRILPESNRFKACTTQPSADMNWKETFIFQKFPTHQVQRMALEIGVWVHDETTAGTRLNAQLAQPICEALIPIQSARERNTDFWPLRPPPSSPQTRRKSLNDLMGSHYSTTGTAAAAATNSAGWPQLRQVATMAPPGSYQQPYPSGGRLSSAGLESGGTGKHRSPVSSVQRISPNESPTRRAGGYTRERSASNRNLPSAGKLQAGQPRRASDEVATSSSHRLMARISPAASRRSISVMNVGGDHLSQQQAHSGGNTSASATATATNSQASSRPQSGSLKGNVQAMRRDSSQVQQQQQKGQLRQMSSTGSGSPTNKYGTPTGSCSRASDSQTPVTTTPSGRRSSLVGVQSMAGYRSQKNSQSDTTDLESPLNSLACPPARRSRESSLVQAIAPQMMSQQQQQATNPIGQSPCGNIGPDMKHHQYQVRQHQQQQQQTSNSGPTSAYPSCSSNSNSRRGSSADQTPQLQRRGSFAMQTFRKLKRTMSLTKGSDSQPGSNQDSRRSSSSSSNQSASEPGEDMAVSRSVKSESVGRVKLAFIMTKGQFEVEVISAQALKFDQSSAVGIYVKTYLKARSRSNKRKTRSVPPGDSPVFKQTIRYDGSLVDNKTLEVGVWAKQSGLRGGLPIGFTEVRLADLNLSQLQTSWYNLRSTDTLSSSSIED